MNRKYSPVPQQSKEDKIAKEFAFIEKFLSLDTKGMKKKQKERISTLVEKLKFYTDRANMDGAKQIFLKAHNIKPGNSFNDNQLAKTIVCKIKNLYPSLKTFDLKSNLFI